MNGECNVAVARRHCVKANLATRKRAEEFFEHCAGNYHIANGAPLENGNLTNVVPTRESRIFCRHCLPLITCQTQKA